MRDLVVILTNPANDLHADVIKLELERRGERAVLLDPKDIATGLLAISIDRGRTKAFLSVDGVGEINTGEIKSVLYRRPQSVVENDQVDEIYRPLVREEWSHAVESLWRITKDECKWISNPIDIRAADSKPFQLQMASEMGFIVPRTLITNSHSDLCRFYAGTPFIVKKLRSHGVVTETKLALFVSKLFESPGDLDEFDLSLCPMIFQDFIDKQFDLRVTVVEERVFAVRIDSQLSGETRVDYRVIQGKLLSVPHQLYDLPSAIGDACLKMTKSLNLNFAAFDFAVDAEGGHWFLEVNPNGQWLWLQIVTGVPIAQALCDALSSTPDELPRRSREFSPISSLI